MSQVILTDNLIDSLFDHPKFMERLKRVQESEPFQKSNELTKSECSQIKTSTQSTIDSELIVQQISILLLDNMNKQIDEQLKNQISLSNWFLIKIR